GKRAPGFRFGRLANYRHGRQGGPAIRGLQWRERADAGAGQRPRIPGIQATGHAGPRILRSEIIQMKMRPGGREIASLETHAPSELEFLPNLASQRHRKFIGERMWISYGAQNRIESFSAVNCRTVS